MIDASLECVWKRVSGHVGDGKRKVRGSTVDSPNTITSYILPPHPLIIILATLSRTAILDTKPGGKPDDHTSTKVARSVIPTHQEEQGCRSKSSRRMLLGGTASDKIVSRISYSSPGMGTRCSQYCGLHLVYSHTTT
jgi:hypothetical protein